MKINDYKNTLNRMHPREELEADIIEKCMNTETKKFKKRRFAPVLAVAAALCIGTVGVSAAMNFDWIKSFFEDDFVISEDIEALVAQTSNYECYSNCGIKMSLEGVVADEQSIYCQFNIDELPEGYNIENLSTLRFSSQSFNEFGDEQSSYSAKYSGNVNEEGKFILSYSSDVPMFKNNDKIAIHLVNFEQFPKMEDFATIYDLPDYEVYPYDLMTSENLETYDNDWDNVLIKFDLNFNDIPSLELSEKEIGTDSNYDKITVTPFKLISESENIGLPGYPVRIVFDSGKEIVVEYDSYSISSSSGDESSQTIVIDSEYTESSENDESFSYEVAVVENAMENLSRRIYEFGEPINPEKIFEIYIGNECIYTK